MTRLLLIDDDDTTREVLGVLLRADGWEVTDAASGDAAVALAGSLQPEVVLSDVQMPGLCGAPLARALRKVCAGPVLLAMTATPTSTAPEGFDALLVKPFPAGAVRDAACGLFPSEERADSGEPVLAMDTFDAMKAAMPAAQLRALYHFALDDAAGRVRAMKTAADDAGFRREAHALKGSCGMIGALRLQALAASAEVWGLPVSSIRWKMVLDFHGEILAVRRMLEELFPGDK